MNESHWITSRQRKSIIICMSIDKGNPSIHLSTGIDNARHPIWIVDLPWQHTHELDGDSMLLCISLECPGKLKHREWITPLDHASYKCRTKCKYRICTVRSGYLAALNLSHLEQLLCSPLCFPRHMATGIILQSTSRFYWQLEWFSPGENIVCHIVETWNSCGHHRVTTCSILESLSPLQSQLPCFSRCI